MRLNKSPLSTASIACHNIAIALFALALCLSFIECPLRAAPAAPASGDAATFSGKVVETMNAASYTYVLLQTGKEKKWVAAPQFTVKIGDTVSVASGMPMANYHSKTLQRDFDVVYFTGEVTVNGRSPQAASEALPKDHPAIGHHSATAAPAPDFTGLKKADGGKTVTEIVTGASKLKGKSVKVRGKVVKYNSMVMGKNWLHIRDGSGAEGSNDLTITTSSAAKLGDTVLVTGKVSTDRDFGAGYKYPIIIEDAQVTVE